MAAMWVKTLLKESPALDPSLRTGCNFVAGFETRTNNRDDEI